MSYTAVISEPGGAQLIPDPHAQPFCDVQEGAGILRVHPKTLLTAIHAEEVPAVRVGRQFRIPTAWLLSRAGSVEDA